MTEPEVLSPKAAPSYLAEPWPQLRERLRARGLRPGELRRAQRALAGPDPAGIMGPISRSDVARVAAHMNPRRETYVVWSELWEIVAEGRPPARAIAYHELAEIAELDRLGETDPDTLDRQGEPYAAAHAWACWAEAQYWVAWSGAEGELISAEGFLFGHPWRSEREKGNVAARLRAQGRVAFRPGPLELSRARNFYAAHGVQPR